MVRLSGEGTVGKHLGLTLALLLMLPASAGDAPWAKPQAVLDATQADYAKGGIRTVADHAADLAQALEAGDAAPVTADGTVYVLADGAADSLVALAEESKGHPQAHVVAVANPYPLISLYLGSYDNEIARSEDALKALDRGLALCSVFAEHRVLVISERGASLMALKRWPEALSDYEEGLKLAGLDDKSKARLHRGRGFALTELGRLDEAAAAYRTSLELEPGNPIAVGELNYIAHLKAGGSKAPATITLPN